MSFLTPKLDYFCRPNVTQGSSHLLEENFHGWLEEVGQLVEEAKEVIYRI